MEVVQARKHFLTFEGTATDNEFPLNSTFIHDILLLPEMFTRPRQGANQTYFSFYDHDATQSECAHRLRTTGGGRWSYRSSPCVTNPISVSYPGFSNAATRGSGPSLFLL